MEQPLCPFCGMHVHQPCRSKDEVADCPFIMNALNEEARCVGLFGLLTPEQQQAVLTHKGEQDCGIPGFKKYEENK